MAVKTYRALRQGYVDGRVINEGEVFTTEFKEIVREEPKAGDLARWEKNGGAKPVGAIKRDKDGNAVTKPADAPSWAEEVDKKTAAAQVAATDPFPDDVNLDAMSKSALQAYAAERGVPFDKSTGVEELKTAIRAANDPTR